MSTFAVHLSNNLKKEIEVPYYGSRIQVNKQSGPNH